MQGDRLGVQLCRALNVSRLALQSGPLRQRARPQKLVALARLSERDSGFVPLTSFAQDHTETHLLQERGIFSALFHMDSVCLAVPALCAEKVSATP